ncbi:hypothetical protein [Rhizohabitans arisaemae]|uniref:hypothetical protein n=1 Tax=Rhizohabitans arisaemae TaxID=2720610 RepID=UPI0024B0617B|nr:hypothetical protein [Rhizohabitans arisaemae]
MLGRLIAAAALVLSGLHAPAAANAAVNDTQSEWLTKYSALESQIGHTAYQNPDSANLAWNESYILRSYLDVYSVTGNTAWLDKLVTHTDQVIADADDLDGDGYLGWSTARYSPVELLNPGFETATTGDATLPANWTRFQDTGTYVYRSTDVPPDVTGSRSVRIVAGENKWKKLHQTVASTYEGGTRHKLRGWGKRTDQSVGRIVLRNGTATVCMLEYTTSTWTYKETVCEMPAGQTYSVWLEHADYTKPGSAYFDDVKLSGMFPYIVHDGMIGLPMAEFIRLVHQTPALASYATKAASYRTFLETEIVPRWQLSSYIGNTWHPIGATEGLYRQSPNFDVFSHTRPSDDLPYNMPLVFAHLLRVLHSVNSDPAYLDRATRIAHWARNDLTVSGTAYVWNYATYTTMKEDLSHANMDLEAFLEFHRRGSVFTADDMTKLKNTFTTKMWSGTVTAPEFSRYVDGTPHPSIPHNQDHMDYYLHSWVELAAFDPQVRTLVVNKYANFTPENSGHLITLSRLLKGA